MKIAGVEKRVYLFCLRMRASQVPCGPLLFQFLAERYERGAVLVTSNLEFSRWGEVFGDATLSAALLDWLTHHAHILLFNGQSYRFKESQEKQIAAAAAL